MANNRIDINLTNAEVDWLYRLAEERNRKAADLGNRNWSGEEDSENKHIFGTVTEFAVARLFGEDVDKRIFNLSGDAGVDVESYKYGNHSIKATSFTVEPYLRVPLSEHPVKTQLVDFFTLCYYEPSKSRNFLQIIGFATKPELLSAPHKQFELRKRLPNGDKQYGPWNYLLCENDLHNFSQKLLLRYRRRMAHQYAIV